MTTATLPVSKKQREAFEKWCADAGFRFEFTRGFCAKIYDNPLMEDMFIAWCGAIATLLPVLKRAEEALELCHKWTEAPDARRKGEEALAALRGVMGDA